jgi:uncharacterized membrane protein YhaH (DUF805 family)
MRSLFSFKGRIRRSDYWVFFLFCNGINWLLVEVTDNSLKGLLVYYAFFIPLVWIFFAQGARRSHDMGDTGFLQILPWHYLSLLFKEGHKGPNEYGKNSKSEDDKK